MKTFRTYKNKNNIMNRLALLFSVLFAINATAKINNDSYYLNIDSIDANCEEHELEKIVFANIEDSTFENFDINSIEVIELEEEVEFNFNPKDYLPEGFNALKGMYDLDWNTIELVELEEEVEFNFNPKDYLPVGYNALKGKHDLDWNTIELVELEEEVEFNFNPKNYLPEGFNALKGKYDLDWNTIELVELEEEVEFDFDTNDYLPNNFNPYKGMHSNNAIACLY